MYLTRPSDDKVGCRLPPFISMPSMRLAFDRLGPPVVSPTSGLLLEALGMSAGAPMTPNPLHPSNYSLSPCHLFYPTSAAAAAAAAAAAQHYTAMGLALATSNSGAPSSADFNSSIADLREKARRHAESLAALLPHGIGLQV